tara:strand:+ start:2137 stop:2424 length:288 start_codon:yes stop_codon:yes gene_type:complete
MCPLELMGIYGISWDYLVSQLNPALNCLFNNIFFLYARQAAKKGIFHKYIGFFYIPLMITKPSKKCINYVQKYLKELKLAIFDKKRLKEHITNPC